MLPVSVIDKRTICLGYLKALQKTREFVFDSGATLDLKLVRH